MKRWLKKNRSHFNEFGSSMVCLYIICGEHKILSFKTGIWSESRTANQTMTLRRKDLEHCIGWRKSVDGCGLRPFVVTFYKPQMYINVYTSDDYE